MSTYSGIVRLKFKLDSSEEYEPVNDQVAVVSDENVMGHYFDDMEKGLLRESCCQFNLNLLNRFCQNANHPIKFYSSCGWMGNQRRAVTDGVVFIEYGIFKIPLSIAGIDIAVSDENIDIDLNGEGNCERCSIKRQGCVSYHPTIEDVRDLLKLQALQRTFLKLSAGILPPSIEVVIPENSTRTAFSPIDFYARLIKTSMIRSLTECTNLIPPDILSSGLSYIIAISSDLSVSYNQQNVTYIHLPGNHPVCFMRSLCSDSEDSITVGITNSLSKKVLSLGMFQNYIQKGWSIDLYSLTTSRFGLGVRQPTIYWDGHSETVIRLSAYDTLLNMKVSGKFDGDFLTVKVFFAGSLTTSSTNKVSTICSVSYIVLFRSLCVHHTCRYLGK